MGVGLSIVLQTYVEAPPELVEVYRQRVFAAQSDAMGYVELRLMGMQAAIQLISGSAICSKEAGETKKAETNRALMVVSNCFSTSLGVGTMHSLAYDAVRTSLTGNAAVNRRLGFAVDTSVCLGRRLQDEQQRERFTQGFTFFLANLLHALKAETPSISLFTADLRGCCLDTEASLWLARSFMTRVKNCSEEVNEHGLFCQSLQTVLLSNNCIMSQGILCLLDTLLESSPSKQTKPSRPWLSDLRFIDLRQNDCVAEALLTEVKGRLSVSPATTVLLVSPSPPSATTATSQKDEKNKKKTSLEGTLQFPPAQKLLGETKKSAPPPRAHMRDNSSEAPTPPPPRGEQDLHSRHQTRPGVKPLDSLRVETTSTYKHKPDEHEAISNPPERQTTLQAQNGKNNCSQPMEDGASCVAERFASVSYSGQTWSPPPTPTQPQRRRRASSTRINATKARASTPAPTVSRHMRYSKALIDRRESDAAYAHEQQQYQARQPRKSRDFRAMHGDSPLRAGNPVSSPRALVQSDSTPRRAIQRKPSSQIAPGIYCTHVDDSFIIPQRDAFASPSQFLNTPSRSREGSPQPKPGMVGQRAGLDYAMAVVPSSYDNVSCASFLRHSVLSTRQYNGALAPVNQKLRTNTH